MWLLVLIDFIQFSELIFINKFTLSIMMLITVFCPLFILLYFS